MNQTKSGFLHSLTEERDQLKRRLLALEVTIKAYSEPTAVLPPAVTTNTLKPKLRQVRKAKRHYAEVTPEVRAKVLELSSLPDGERPSWPKIAAQTGVSLSTVTRIRKAGK